MQGASVKYLEAIYKDLEQEVGRSFIKIIHTNNRDPKFSEVNGAPNPTEPNSAKNLILLVSEEKSTLGLAVDGDGDRFGVFDFEGTELSANEIIFILTYFLSQKGLQGAIGKTVVTSNAVNSIAEYLGLELIETSVGFKWFVEQTVREGTHFLVAGEESAHVGVKPFMKSWDDGLAIGLMCLWMIAETQQSLTSYKEEVENTINKHFIYTRDNIELTQEVKDRAVLLIQEAKREQMHIKDIEELSITQKVKALNILQKVDKLITLDGLKLVFDTGDWFCIRLSGTENVARLYVEATNIKMCDCLRYLGKALLGTSPEKELAELIQASKKQTREEIPEANRYRTIGFEEENARLGWIIPPNWQDIKRRLDEFLNLSVVKDKTCCILSGMGGSINTIKALNQMLGDQSSIRLQTIDSLDPATLREVLSSAIALSKTLVIGISKSGTTKETQLILKAFKERFKAQQLDYRDHFLWFTDIPRGKQNIEKAEWEDINIFPIQVDKRNDLPYTITVTPKQELESNERSVE
jgi:hypothetical protein